MMLLALLNKVYNKTIKILSEYLDIYDRAGNPTGIKKLRSEVHRDGDWHKTVHVWIMNSKDELLIQKRAPQVEVCPNQWDISSAGHVRAGATTKETAKREVKEELGIDTSGMKPKYLFTVFRQSFHHDGTYINSSINEVFLVRHDIDLDNLILQVEEVSAARWIKWQTLKEEIKKYPDL